MTSAARSTVIASPGSTRTRAVGTAGPRRRRTLRKASASRSVELERDDVVPGVEQRERERAEPGPDLEHRCAGGQVGEGDDPPRGVGVDEEVLAEAPLGVEPVRVEQRVHRRRE